MLTSKKIKLIYDFYENYNDFDYNKILLSKFNYKT